MFDALQLSNYPLEISDSNLNSIYSLKNTGFEIDIQTNLQE